MMTISKRERLHHAIDRLQALVCPVCAAALTRAGEDYRCPNRHSVNVNRKGCLNVLSAQVDSCYDDALFAARRRVFAAGCYLPVVEAIERLLPAGDHRLMDAGCGDGWYLNALLERHPSWVGAGVDISRDAIFRATEHPCEAVWCVADLRRLPFADGAFTAVLDVLTPASYDEFTRILAPDGVIVKVYPGQNYLRELRAARNLPLYEEGQVERYLREKADVIAHERVVNVCPTDDALWRDFVWMTPLNQDLSAAEKDAIAAQNAGTVTVDLNVAVCRRKG